MAAKKKAQPKRKLTDAERIQTTANEVERRNKSKQWTDYLPNLSPKPKDQPKSSGKTAPKPVSSPSKCDDVPELCERMPFKANKKK
jgi:hypothetical protein